MQHQIISAPVQLLKAQTAGVLPVDLVDGGGEGTPFLERFGGTDFCVRLEGLYRELLFAVHFVFGELGGWRGEGMCGDEQGKARRWTAWAWEREKKVCSCFEENRWVVTEESVLIAWVITTSSVVACRDVGANSCVFDCK